MKKKIYLLAGALFVFSLCSCSIQISTNGNHQESSSTTTSSSSSESNSSEAPSIPENSTSSDSSISDSTAASPSVTPDGISSSLSDANESTSDAKASPDTYTLTRYASIYDVPYAELDYDERGHNLLTKNGKPWVGAPSGDQFGGICFSDGHNFYIQCFSSYNDTLSTDFRWFCANLNHFDDDRSDFLPDETMNQLFAGADGETLYTEDGYQYKLSTMPWCQDGTCKR